MSLYEKITIKKQEHNRFFFGYKLRVLLLDWNESVDNRNTASKDITLFHLQDIAAFGNAASH
jgi:hypothetical protein